MTSRFRTASFSFSLRVAALLAWVLVMVFAVYVASEKQIDVANELRYQSRLLVEELRQSSDDLTRMARTYVMTGAPEYKQHYFEILDIRDGKRARPGNYQSMYWYLATDHPPVPPEAEGEKKPLLQKMREAGFQPDEFHQMALAKDNSDRLTALEREAMALVEILGPGLDARRIRAGQMLHNVAYHEAKARIMAPLDAFYQLSDARTLAAVHAAERQATVLRAVFVLVGLGLLLALWRSFRTLQATLGGRLDAIHTHITRIGQGHFSDAMAVAPNRQESVLGWLVQTQHRLNAMEQAHLESEAKLRQLARLYAALSDCNQAIVRCTDETELYAQICRSAVDHGGMRMAWISMVDTEHGPLRTVAAYGVGADAPQELGIVADGSAPMGTGPTGQALHTDQPYWCQHYQTDPVTEPWHAWGARFGWAASAALPLHRDGRVVGVLTVYASEAGAFDEPVQNLLVEMASDIDYALRN
ncbi:MAG: GAF domain-containing protein, partial [Rhodoferax sp.]